MGNIEGAHRWDADLEARRQLPSCRQDLHWHVVGFQHLFDADYLNKEFRLTDDGQPQDTGSSAAGGTASAKNRSFEEHCHEEAIDLADATFLLLMDPPKGMDIGAETSRRLIRELVSQCQVNDRFLKVIAQRSHMLHCVHEAWVRAYQEREAAISTAPRSGSGSPGKQYCKARPDGDSPVVSSAEAPLGAAQWSLALALLSSLLHDAHEPGAHPALRPELVQQITAVLDDFPALSLRKEGPTVSSQLLSSGTSSWHECGVLDKLRDFLYLTCLPDADQSFLAAAGQEAGTNQAQAWAAHEQVREAAVLALTALVSVAGRAKDILLLIKLLLRVGHPRPTSGNQGTDEQSMPLGICSMPSGNLASPRTVPCVAGIASNQAQVTPVRKATQRRGLRRPLRLSATGPLEVEVGGGSAMTMGSTLVIPEALSSPQSLATSAEPSCVSVKRAKPYRPSLLGAEGKPVPHACRTPRAPSGPLPVRALPPQLLPFLRHVHGATTHGHGGLRQAEEACGQQREVWTCGQNSYGELAHGDTASRKAHTIVELCADRDIVGVAAGNEHTVVLTRSGDVYTAGYNDNGQCGVGATQRVGQLTLIEKLAGKSAAQVHAYNGCEHTLVVLQDGRLMSFGYNYRGQLGHGTTTSEAVPRLVRGLEGKRVTLVSCSYYHSIVACESGEVYTFGRNDYGQLGHGDLVDKKTPHLADGLRGHVPTSLACGQYHTLVATRDGRLFSCGKNDYGQLGVEGAEWHKHIVSVPMDSSVTEVRCGYYHTLVLCEGGRVFGFGRNDYGQLGLGHIAQRVHGPQLLEALEGKPIVRLAAGCYHSLLVARNGMLYVCGRNNHGQLGTGDTNERHSPHPIDLFLGKRVAHVAAGFYHTIVLTGGVESEGAASSAGADCAAFSPGTFLSLPSFTLPPPQLSVKPSAASPAASEETQALHCSPEDEALEMGTQGQDLARIRALLCTPSEGLPSPSPLTPRASTASDPWECTEGGHTNQSPGPPRALEADKPNGEKLLCNGDGSVPEEKAGIFLLAQLDRLASQLCPRTTFPAALSSRVAQLGGPPGNYCVDGSPETLELLLCLLTHLHESSASSVLADVDLGSDSTTFVHAYCLLACLRILHANLLHLLHTPLCLLVRQVLRGLSAPSMDGLDDLSSLHDDSMLSAPHPHIAELFRNDVFLGLSETQVEETMPNSADEPARRVAYVLCALHHQLLELIQSPPLMADTVAINAIQQEAGLLLVMGMELFYPTQMHLCQLLSELVSPVSALDANEEEEEEAHRVGPSDIAMSGRAAAQRVLLQPLLRRLCDDHVALQLLPKEPGSSAGGSQDAEAVANQAEAVSSLSCLLQVLVHRALHDAFLDQHGNYGRSELDGLFQQHNAYGTGASAGGAGSSQESLKGSTAALLMNAILVIQKHLMNWAACQSPPPLVLLGVEDASLSLKGSALGRSVLEGVAGRLKEQHSPESWSCLVEYVTTAFTQATDVLLQLPGLSEERQMRTPMGPEVDCISSQDLSHIEDSFIGTVLPSLVTGLLPFAYQPALALKLMPLVSELYRVLSRIAAALPDMVALDHSYARQRSGDLPPEGQMGAGLVTPPVSMARAKRSGAGHSSSAAPDGRRGIDALQLPRFYCLLKSLAFLAGRLAGTLTAGEGQCRKCMASLQADAMLNRWACAPLLSGGLDPTCGELLGRPVVVLTPTHRPRAPAQNCRTSHHSEGSVSLGSGLPSSARLAALFDGLCAGTEGQGLLHRFRDQVKTSDATYALLWRQAERAADVALVQEMERSVWAAVLRHSGLSMELFLRTKATQQTRLPQRWSKAYTHVAEVFRWFCQCRSELKSLDTPDAQARATELPRVVARAACVLLLVIPQASTARSLLHVPGANDLPSQAHSTEDRQPSSWKPKLRRTLLAVRAMLRWRTHVTRNDNTGQEVSKLLRELCGETPQAQQDREESSASRSMGGSWLQRLVCLVLDNHRRALVRDLGFRSFQSLLQGTKLSSLAVEVLHALGPALRDTHTVNGHYLSKLHAVGDRLHRQVQRSFESLYEELCRRIDELVTQWRPSRVVCPPTMSTTLPYECASSIGSQQQGPWDMGLMLSLLDAWGLRFTQRDWAFLINSGILTVLQRLMHTLSATLSNANDALSTNDDGRTDATGRTSPSSLSGLSASSHKGRASSRSGMSAAVKEKERKAKQCINAAWLLLRLLASQIPGMSPSETGALLTCKLSWSLWLQPLFDILREEARESISRISSFTRARLLASRGGGKDGLTGQDGSGGEASPGLGGGRLQGNGEGNQRKRCQELIGSPRRFLHLEDGFVFPADQLLCNPGRVSDFSLSMWLYLTQDSTGQYRTIITRGHKSERWPVVMLRDVDRRIEVGFGLHNMATLCERLTSKDPVPLNKWTHICLVSEGSKLRLYMNGSLDYQRSNLGVPKDCKHPLYVGKVPDGMVRLQGVKGGFEGSLASLRYYTRALSPIHVRIVCDQGPPELVRLKDRKCFQLCSVIYLLAQSPLARPHLCARPWLDLVLALLLHGTARVQQAAARTLQRLVRDTDPRVLSSLSLLDSASPLELPCLQQATQVEPGSAVRFFLLLIGLVVRRTFLDVVPHVYASLRENKTLPLLAEVNVHSAVTNHETLAHFLPSSLAACCLHSPAEGAAPGEAAGAVPTLAMRLPSDTVQDACALASELTTLLQHMATLPRWRDVVVQALSQALQGLLQSQPDSGQVTDDARLRHAEGLAALSVLGAHTDCIRTGVRVAMRGTDSSGVIVGYDEMAGLAHVLMEGHDAEAWSKKAASAVGPSKMKIVRIHAHEVFVTGDMERSKKLWHEEGPGNAMAAAGTALIAAVCHMTNALKVGGSPSSSRSASSFAAPTADEGSDSVRGSWGSERQVSGAEAALAAHTRSMCVKAALVMLSDARLLQSSLQVQGPGKSKPLLLESLLLLANQPDPSPTFVVSSETELRCSVLRRRLFQLLPSEPVWPLAPAPANTTRPTSADSSTTVQHMGTSLLNCPACLTCLPGGLRCNRTLLSSSYSNGLPTSAAPSTDAEHPFPHSDEAQDREDSSSTPLGGERNEESREGSINGNEDGQNVAPISTELQDQLTVMGFPEEWCALALRENGNDIINASSWIVDNLDMLTRLSELQKRVGEGAEQEDDDDDGFGHSSAAEDDDDTQDAQHVSDANDEAPDHGSTHSQAGEEQEEGNKREGDSSGHTHGRHDSDVTDLGMLEDQTDEEGSAQGASLSCSASDKSRSRGAMEGDDRLLSLTPGSASTFGLLEDRDRFAEECAADAYTEVYFLAESNPPAAGSQTCSSTPPGSNDGVWQKGEVTKGRSASDVEPVGRMKALLAEVAAMDHSQLLSTVQRMETSLAILHARAAILKVLVAWPHDCDLDWTLLGHHHLLLQLIKVTVFRGCQFDRLDSILEGCEPVFRGPVQKRRTHPDTTHAQLASALGSVLLRLLKAEMAGSDSTMPEVLAYSGGSRVAFEETHNLGSLLTYCCIDELEAAALIGAFSDMHWGRRALQMPDSLALLQPNVELAFWMVDILLLLEHPQIYTVGVFTRLCNCLRSANLPLKETVFKVLTRVLSRWVDMIEEAQQLLDAQSQDAASSDQENSTDQDTSTSSSASVSAMARVTVIREALSRHLSVSRIQATLLRRIGYERREARLFFSSYVRSAADFMCIMAHLQQLLARLGNATIPPPSCEPWGSLLMQDGTGSISECNAFGPLDFEATLEAPVVQQTSASALVVQWHDPCMSPSRPSTLQSTAPPSACPSSIFELQVWDRASGLPCPPPDDTLATSEQEGQRAVPTGHYRPLYRGPALQYRMEGVCASRLYHFRIRSTSGGGGRVGRWSHATSIETKALVPFTFDRLNAGPNILVSRDNMAASFAGNEAWSTVLGTTGFLFGKNYWEVHIDKSSTSYLFIGVARRQADLGTFLGGDEHGWGFIGDRALYHGRSKLKAYGQRFGEGDRVGVTLDLDVGTLSFSRNGVDLGLAFTGLSGELYAAVAFYNNNQRVSLSPHTFVCPGAGVTVPGCPASVGIGEIVEVWQIMNTMLARQPLPAAIAREAFRAFLAWDAGTTFRCLTIAGYELQVNTSDDACRPFGFTSGDRVRTPRGNATMIGVTDGQPWFQVDGEAGIWFFTVQAIRDGRERKGYFTPTPAFPRRPRSRLTDMCKEAAVAFPQVAGEGLSRPGTGAMMPLEAFLEHGDNVRWTAGMDALLVRAVNELCGLKQLCPWNLTTRLLLATVTPVRPDLDALARDAALPRGASTILNQDPQRPWPLGSPAAGSYVTDQAILARFAVLRLFNERLVNVLPFVGLGDGLPCVASPTVMASVWQSNSPVPGLGLGEHPRDYRHGSRSFSQGGGKGLGPMLCTLRGSVFTVSKERVLQAAISRTMTVSKKADDDYDYPEDLPQVLLNRPKALKARKDADPEARLAMSLFAQLFEQLRNLEPPLLRMGYTHPMDDGQHRTFKVKFEGEGVDDYGGPYRETFAQVSEELQMLWRPEGGAVGGDLQCLLPLLEPSSNARARVASQSSFCDSVLLQASRARQADLDMFCFLGQLIGIALRSRVFMRVGFPSVVWKAMVGEPVVEADLADVDHTAYALVLRTTQLCRAVSRERTRVQQRPPGEGARDAELKRWTAELEETLQGMSWSPTHPGAGHDTGLSDGAQTQASGVYEAKLCLQALVHQTLHQHDVGLAALRDGLSRVVPPAVLPLLTWYEVRGLVCGRKPIDLDLLQANTEYDDDVAPEDAHIVYFWSILRDDFDEAELSHFLRFVWARPSLPGSAAEFQQKFKIQSAVSEGAKECPDAYLPKAHTCFFSLNLPRYSSKEVMAAKLRYAMYNCVEMDADFRLAESEMTGWDID